VGNRCADHVTPLWH